MPSVISTIEDRMRKHHVVDVKSGDTVRVHQKIREGNKERVQVFEGMVIRIDRKGSHTASITVRRIASGVGVEKTYLLHSPLVVKIEVTKRSKVRRNYLTYMRARTGKSARLSNVAFDRQAVNEVPEEPVKDESKIEDQPVEAPEEKAAEQPADEPVDKTPETEEKPSVEKAEEPKTDKK